ncbi:Acyl-CoA dehydrogenase fadE12 [Variovorax sp. SRS16]|uniref:acyl-CoA dehydrogenase n=1 Tax=Variovorax sp. SRS16 TaxID=282217 RepID=UPI0013174E9A|nr:acyl-CoA dehydrogenase [Variovorax sp. SRS16]VTU24416.1 Acyl-CoA dehydrogenase fadE12 [Variovorax sp. SRS16]
MSTLSHDERASLADALSRVLARQYGFASGRRQNLAIAPEQLPPIWSTLSELGLHAVMVSPDFGGFGGGADEIQLVQRQFGRSLLVAPWFQVAICAHAVARAGSPTQQGALLPPLSDGRAVMVLADRDAVELDAEPKVTQAHDTARGWRLEGRKTAVLHAGLATHYLVPAVTPNGGTGLFVVDSSAVGIGCHLSRLVDGSWSGDLRFESVDAQPLEGLSLQHHGEVYRSTEALAIAGVTADALGACEAALEMTVQHLRTRKQFGQSLGDYQALRHRVAEMYIELEQVKSACDLAAEAVEGVDSVQPTRGTAQALLVMSQSATWILQQAIQLHGGMGMTDEVAVGHCYRRMLVLNARWGDTREALARLRGDGMTKEMPGVAGS